MGPGPKTIDEYLAGLSADKRAAIERLRDIIQAEAPAAEECISYGLPAFRLDGKALIWFGAAAKHCAIYGVQESFKGEFKLRRQRQGHAAFSPGESSLGRARTEVGQGADCQGRGATDYTAGRRETREEKRRVDCDGLKRCWRSRIPTLRFKTAPAIGLAR